MKFTVMLSGQMTSFLCPIRSQYDFIKLYGYQKYVRIVGLLKVENETVKPRGLRLFFDVAALKQAQDNNLCGLEFMDFESALSDTLRSTPYIVEKQRSKDAKDLRETLEIFSDLYWSFKTLDFVRGPGPIVSLNIRPTSLVFDGTKDWQETILSQVHCAQRRAKPPNSLDNLVSSNCTLIVTKDHADWSETCARMSFDSVVVDASGVPVEALNQNSANGSSVLLCHPDTLMQNVLTGTLMRSTIKNLVGHVTDAPRSDNQVRRFIVDNLARKLNSFVVPLEYIQVACVIIDDLDSMSLGLNDNYSKLGLKFHQVFRDPHATKPKGLTRSQLKLFVSEPYHLSLFGSVIDASVNIVQAPRALLKRFKVFPHLVKKNAIEERIDKIFAGHRLPMAHSDLIQRFSGKPLSLGSAKTLVTKHFDCLQSSFGQYVTLQQTEESTISSAYALRAFGELESPRKCTVCYDDVDSMPKFSITICGHIFCKECCKMHFNNEWLAFKSKDCPACRLPLLSGDAFFIEDDPKPVVGVSSKQLALDNFYASMRTTTNVVVWPEKSDAYLKHLIVTDLEHITPAKLINEYASRTNSINVHVFYTSDQSAELNEFVAAFK